MAGFHSLAFISIKRNRWADELDQPVDLLGFDFQWTLSHRVHSLVPSTLLSPTALWWCFAPLTYSRPYGTSEPAGYEPFWRSLRLVSDMLIMLKERRGSFSASLLVYTTDFLNYPTSLEGWVDRVLKPVISL